MAASSTVASGTAIYAKPQSQGEMNGTGMANGDLNRLTNFICGIADDMLRDLHLRGK